MKRLMTLLLATVAGCSQNVPVGTNPEPVNVSVSVTLAGAPVDGLKFNFQPIGDGLPAVLDIKNGSAKRSRHPRQLHLVHLRIRKGPGRSEDS